MPKLSSVAPGVILDVDEIAGGSLDANTGALSVTLRGGGLVTITDTVAAANLWNYLVGQVQQTAATFTDVQISQVDVAVVPVPVILGGPLKVG